jgi:hypothetical protein
MKKEDVDKHADGKTTRTVRLKDGQVLTGSLEGHDDGTYHVHPSPSKPQQVQGGFLQDIDAEEIESID